MEHFPNYSQCHSCSCAKFRRVSRNKYFAQRAEYQGGTYHSKRERDYAFELDLRLRAGEIKAIRRQVPIRLDVNGSHICNYVIDFVVEYPDGVEEFIEVKGFETQEWRFKWRVFEALYKDRANTRLLVVR